MSVSGSVDFYTPTGSYKENQHLTWIHSLASKFWNLKWNSYYFLFYQKQWNWLHKILFLNIRYSNVKYKSLNFLKSVHVKDINMTNKGKSQILFPKCHWIYFFPHPLIIEGKTIKIHVVTIVVSVFNMSSPLTCLT